MVYSSESRYQAGKRRYANMTDEAKLKKSKSDYKSMRENREGWERLKERQKNYKIEMKEIWIERGLCSICGKERENLNFKGCTRCREYSKEYNRKRYQKSTREVKE